MIQCYFLSVVYLAVSGLLRLFDNHRSMLLFLLSFRQALSDNKKLRLAMGCGGFLLALLLTFFPVSPGPRALGDLIPAVFLVTEAVNYLRFAAKSSQILKNSEKDRIMGYAVLAAAAVHFLFPMGVLV
jgi:hypothetical protein